jgi:hypothetical protein
MSKLFFDHLIELTEIDRLIKKAAKNASEREELWAIVDEIVHHKVMGCILDKLPKGDHEDFLNLFHKSPHDTSAIFDYLSLKVGKDMESLIRKEIDNLNNELIEDLKLG